MASRSFSGCFNPPGVSEDDLLGLTSENLSLKSGLLDLRFESSSLRNYLLDLTSENSGLRNGLLDITPEDLSLFTDKFSEDNLVGLTPFGELYRAKMSALGSDCEITKVFAVKILNHSWLLESELDFLLDPMIMGYKNLVKVIGCCREGDNVCVVYDLNPHRTLHKLITQGDFNWLQRVSIALTLARLLDYLHDRKSPYLIRNFDPAHVVVDQNFTPILFEFGMLTGGVLGSRIDESDIEQVVPLGYIDPSVALNRPGYGPGAWTVKSDVYSFGVVLLSLISKRVVDKKNAGETPVQLLAVKEYKPGCSFVHRSLEADTDFDPLDGPKMTELAMQCINDIQEKRPVMKEVVKCLEALNVVQRLVLKKSVPL